MIRDICVLYIYIQLLWFQQPTFQKSELYKQHMISQAWMLKLLIIIMAREIVQAQMLINFASFRSVHAATMEALEYLSTILEGTQGVPRNGGRK